MTGDDQMDEVAGQDTYMHDIEALKAECKFLDWKQISGTCISHLPSMKTNEEILCDWR